MHNFELEGAMYQFPERWEEITLRQMIEYRKTVKMPDSMADVLAVVDPAKAVEKVQELSAEDFDEWEDFKITTAAYWCGMDEQLMNRVKRTDMLAVFFHMIRLMIRVESTVDPTFKYKGETWHLPKMSEIAVLGLNKLQPEITVGEFSEAMQFERLVEKRDRDDWEVLPGLMAILVRKEGEPFSRNLVTDRYEFWLDCPMPHVWNTSFFLARQSVQLVTILRRYGESIAHTRSKQGRGDIPSVLDGTDSSMPLRRVADFIGQIVRRKNQQKGQIFTRRRNGSRTKRGPITSPVN